MSSLIVDVSRIEEIKSHPMADRVELVRTKGWWCVSQIGHWKVGEKCVYFPPDTVIPEALAEACDIVKYVSPLPRNPDGSRPPGYRIRAQRFRGEQSFGFIHKPEDQSWELGKDVVDIYGVTKYDPPISSEGDADTPVASFHAYTGIENIKNFPGILQDGEEVVIEEKIHGTNSRVGIVLLPDEELGEAIWTFVCGSHAVRRKQFNQKGQPSRYWLPLTDEVKGLLVEVCDGMNNVVVFGEIFGPVQDMNYGLNSCSFRAFDISVNGKYLDYDDRNSLLANHGIDSAPCLYRGPFSWDTISKITDGPTTLCLPEKAGKFKGREGVVVRPVKERYDQNLPNFGRVILKSISVDYLSRKGGSEFH